MKKTAFKCMQANQTKTFLPFAAIGLLLIALGIAAKALTGEDGITWALVGSGLAIIWVSFHKVYHPKRA